MLKRKAFFQKIRGFIIFFLIFGLHPIWENDKYKIILIIYSVASIFSVFAIFLSATIIYDEIVDITLSNAVGRSMQISILATHLIIVTQSLFSRITLKQIILKFVNVDRLLKIRLNNSIAYNQEKRAIFIRILFIIIVLLTIKFIFIIHHSMVVNDRYIRFWIHNLYSIWIMRLRCIQVLFFVYLLRARLNMLIEQLKKTAEESNGKLSPQHIVISTISHRKRKLFGRMKSVKQIYSELHDTSELINIAFGWSLLAITTESFITFLSNSYWLFRVLEAKMETYYILDCIFLITPITIILIIMAYYCSSCSHSVNMRLSLF